MGSVNRFPPDGAKRAGRTEDDRNPGASHRIWKWRNAELTVASLEGVNMNYGSVRALRGVDFRVHAGEVVALLGPNGAGKTTAVKLLLGLLQPNSGRARVFGGDPTNPENRMRTGAMLQVGRVPETLRVREHIDLFSTYYPKPMALAEVLAAAGLEKLSERKFGDLSGGQRQRVLFALAICGDPDLVFLRRTYCRARRGSAAHVVG
jgi:ABC-2 type transport system ATP-binding protein